MWRFRQFLSRMGTLPRLVAYVCLLTVAVTGSLWGARVLFSKAMVELAKPSVRPAPRVRPVYAQSRPSYVTLNQDWHDMIRTREFWSARNRDKPSSGTRPVERPSSFLMWPGGNPFDTDDQLQPNPDLRRSGEGTYRTVCVRLCDGYFFPVSFSTTRDNFARDEAQCEKSCTSPTRLYVYRNPGADPEDMRSIDGEPYTKLPAANLFRTKYDAQCRCGPQPWDKEALARHKVYALEEAQRRGDKSAIKKLADMKAQKAAEQRRRALAQKLAYASLRAGSLAVPKPVPGPQRFGRISVRAYATVEVPAPPATVLPPKPDRAAARPQPIMIRGIALPRPTAETPNASRQPVMLMRLGTSPGSTPPIRRDNAVPPKSSLTPRQSATQPVRPAAR